jgi:uncharacterized Rossmann fold enzyme
MEQNLRGFRNALQNAFDSESLLFYFQNLLHYFENFYQSEISNLQIRKRALNFGEDLIMQLSRVLQVDFLTARIMAVHST